MGISTKTWVPITHGSALYTAKSVGNLTRCLRSEELVALEMCNYHRKRCFPQCSDGWQSEDFGLLTQTFNYKSQD